VNVFSVAAQAMQPRAQAIMSSSPAPITETAILPSVLEIGSLPILLAAAQRRRMH